MEIEIPRWLVRTGLFLLLVAVPVLLGMHASPVDQGGRSLLLTPRLARLNEYQHEVKDWVHSFQIADDGLSTLFEGSTGDLFDQNDRVNRTYQQILQVAESLDQTPVPPTFESLHELLAQTAQAYLDTTLKTARWVGEPIDANQQVASDARVAARALLERLYTNPWVEVMP